MAKKKEKTKKKKDSGSPREAVLGAVESTFQRAAGGVQELLDDVATTVKALREANLVETLEGLRDEVQALAKRVGELEVRGPTRPAVRRTGAAARKPAAARSAGAAAAKPASAAAAKPARATARKPAGATARKPAGATARKPARATARKPAGTTARKPASRTPRTPRKPAP